MASALTKMRIENVSVRNVNDGNLATLAGIDYTNVVTEGGGLGLLIAGQTRKVEVVGLVHRLIDVMCQSNLALSIDDAIQVDRTGTDAVIVYDLGISGIADDVEELQTTLEGDTAANVVWAGPASGEADAPKFRALVDDDMPSGTITRISDLEGAVLDDAAANVVYAGPASGEAGEPAFRALVADDLPSDITESLSDAVEDIGDLDGRVTALEDGVAIATQANTGLSTWLNQVDSTVADTAQGMAITSPAKNVAADALRILKKAAPATPYTITAKVKLNAITANFFGVGIGWRDSATGKLETLMLDTGTAMRFLTQRFSALNTVASETSYATSMAVHELWMRIADDGTNRVMSASLDGLNFILLDSTAKAAAYLGAAGYVEVFFYHKILSATAYVSHATLNHWTETA
jgi:hypothetical protein